MKLIELTFLVLQLNAEVDAGRTATLAEVHQHISAGDLFEWLKQRFPQMDLSVNTAPGRDGAGIVSELQALQGGYRGSERGKWGVENNGLCLLIAWVNELLQQRKFTD